MKKLFTWIGISLLLVSCGREEAAEAVVEAQPAQAVPPPVEAYDPAADIKRARQAILLFAGNLQTEFGTAMRNDGPVAAVEVCSTRAALIAQEVSEEYGLNMGRVSLRNRNPSNEPNDWQAEVLMDFEQRHQAGEDLAYINWSEVVGEGDEREFRFMKPIPTHALCLNCHGRNLAPGVEEALASIYPDDAATGFEVGDIRGAFVVTGKPEG
jgi:hypothetical protein